MFYQSSIKKSSQSSLNSAPLRELVVTLNEQTEEFFSGGDSKDRLIGGLGDDRLPRR